LCLILTVQIHLFSFYMVYEIFLLTTTKSKN
jgi:hypothetical protein